MSKAVVLKFFSMGLVFALLVLFCAPLSFSSEASAKASLIGFVYEKDGTTPVEGAVVKIQNVTTGAVYESNKSDALGIFKVEGLKGGIYAFGVSTAQGDFDSGGLVGISGNETAKLAISLTPYESNVAAAVQEVYEEQTEAGESRVGRVINYRPDTKEAEVYIEKGLLQLGDRIHVKGKVTDFYQDVKSLKVEGTTVNRALAGQNTFIVVVKTCETGDIVYVVCKRAIPPLGILGFIAGSGAVVYGFITLVDEDKASPFKK